MVHRPGAEFAKDPQPDRVARQQLVRRAAIPRHDQDVIATHEIHIRGIDRLTQQRGIQIIGRVIGRLALIGKAVQPKTQAVVKALRQTKGQPVRGKAIRLGALIGCGKSVGAIAAQVHRGLGIVIHEGRGIAQRPRRIRPGLGRHALVKPLLRRAQGLDGDHTPHGIRPVKRRLAALQHLDAPDIGGQQLAKVEGHLRAGRIGHVDPVDRDPDIVLRHAADLHPGLRADRPGRAYEHPGDALKIPRQAGIARLLDLRALHQNHRASGAFQRRRRAVRADDDLVQRHLVLRRGAQRCRRQRPCGDQCDARNIQPLHGCLPFLAGVGTPTIAVCLGKGSPPPPTVSASPQADSRLRLRAPRSGKGDLLGRSPGLRVFVRAGLPGALPSGIFRRHSPLTVAGAAADLNRVPFSSDIAAGTEGPPCIERPKPLSSALAPPCRPSRTSRRRWAQMRHARGARGMDHPAPLPHAARAGPWPDPPQQDRRPP